MGEDKKSEPAMPPSDSLPAGKEPEQAAKEIQIHYRRSPSMPPPGQKIHPRQKIPTVPEGEDVPDETPSQPVEAE